MARKQKAKVLTTIAKCGCIIQHKIGRSDSHIYCGNDDCPYDPEGKQSKYR